MPRARNPPLPSEEVARWQVPRPPYVREAEPLAHPGSWPSQDPTIHVDPEEQAFNRMLFKQGRNRKHVSRSSPATTDERKAG